MIVVGAVGPAVILRVRVRLEGPCASNEGPKFSGGRDRAGVGQQAKRGLPPPRGAAGGVGRRCQELAGADALLLHTPFDMAETFTEGHRKPGRGPRQYAHCRLYGLVPPITGPTAASVARAVCGTGIACTSVFSLFLGAGAFSRGSSASASADHGPRVGDRCVAGDVSEGVGSGRAVPGPASGLPRRLGNGSF